MSRKLGAPQLAAIYAWLLTRDPPLDPAYIKASLAIPMVFSVLGLLRWTAIMLRTMSIGAYIQSMEGKAVGEGRGWETILKEFRKKHPIKGRLEGWVEAITWSMTVCGSCGAFIYAMIYL